MPVNAALLAAAAIVVWIAGTRISHYADAISVKTGLDHALLGLVLLAGVLALYAGGLVLLATLR